MKICVVGSGYVGLVSSSCFAEVGHSVVCVDTTDSKITSLKKANIPFYEPGLEELVKKNVEAKKLKFVSKVSDGVPQAEIILLALPSITSVDGTIDVQTVTNSVKEIGRHIVSDCTVLITTAMPAGSCELVRSILHTKLEKFNKTHLKIDVVVNPEFLDEGNAIEEFMNPDRIILGMQNLNSLEIIKTLYNPICKNNPPIITMDVKSAELTRYVSSAILASKTSLMNEMSLLCDVLGADIEEVRKGVGADKRIGFSHLDASIGFGGAVVPRDLHALVKIMKTFRIEPKMVQSILDVNENQRRNFMEKIYARFGHEFKNLTFAVWGASSHSKTDDLFDSPAMSILRSLLAIGAKCIIYDPVCGLNAKQILNNQNVHYSDDMYLALEGCNALLICTDWDMFTCPNEEKMSFLMKEKIIFDGKNILEIQKFESRGWEVHGIGRGDML
jgi:UDPglucose 6-dehydrogenase